MAKAAIQYLDNAGVSHSSPEDATRSDLAAIFGHNTGMANAVLASRNEIEQAFRELDAMKGAKA